MFVLVAAVPALLVVVLGYVAGYAVAQWLGADPGRVPEAVGWTTGVLLLAVVVRLLVGLWRRRAAEDAHQK